MSPPRITVSTGHRLREKKAEKAAASPSQHKKK